MKKASILAFTLIIGAIVLNAQTQDKLINNGYGFGFQLDQYEKDFGLGVSITSPYIIDDKIAFRLRTNLMFNENIQNVITTWTPYSNVSFGCVGIGGMVGDYIRLYGEGGIIGLLPSNKFSTDKFVLGGYGLFGFEFFMNNNINYFIEIGGIGTGATEDIIVTKPIYSNGLLISAGLRVHLK